MKLKRFFSSVVAASALICVSGVLLSVLIFRDPIKLPDSSSSSLPLQVSNFVTQRDIRRNQAIRRSRDARELARVLRIEFRNELRKKTIGYECSTIVRGRFLDPFRSQIRANELISIYKSVLSKNKRQCFKYKRSGIDSSDTSFVLIDPGSVKYLSRGGPKLLERDIVDASLGYWNEYRSFLEFSPDNESIEVGQEIRLRLFFETDDDEGNLRFISL